MLTNFNGNLCRISRRRVTTEQLQMCTVAVEVGAWGTAPSFGPPHFCGDIWIAPPWQTTNNVIMCTILLHFASASRGLRPQTWYRGFSLDPLGDFRLTGSLTPDPHRGAVPPPQILYRLEPNHHRIRNQFLYIFPMWWIDLHFVMLGLNACKSDNWLF